MSNTSVIIAGGGLTGLTMAVALSANDIPVTLIAPDLNVLKKDDKRSTAIMMEGIDFLKHIGVWQFCEKKAAPLEVMRIINGSRTIDFDAQEMDKEAFAINIPNDVLLKALIKKATTAKNIRVINSKVKATTQKSSHIAVTTDKETTINGTLLIAADGRQSTIRSQCNIPAQSHDFNQKAFVCNMKHTKPHHNTSTEIHRAGGPFTIVPLPNDESALVWCDRPDVIDDVMQQPEKDQTALIQKIIPHDMLGDIQITSKPQSWPIHALKAKQLTAPRTVLIGEAAHAIAPIAAQGFNLSLRDITTMTETLMNAQNLGLDFGSSVILKQYEKKRKTDITLRYHSVGFLNTLIANTSLPASVLKKAGLSTMEWISPMRKMAMKFGMRA